jgi:hypothetical protein
MVTDPLPPVFFSQVKDNPIFQDDGTNGPYRLPPLRAFIYSGLVRDSETELPLEFSTVRIYAKGNLLEQQVADSGGRFSIQTNDQADSITISEAEHKTANWPATENQHTFDLERKTGNLPPVILPPGTIHKNKILLWIIAGVIIAKWQKII